MDKRKPHHETGLNFAVPFSLIVPFSGSDPSLGRRVINKHLSNKDRAAN